jgi:hypothetical protein
MPCDESDSRGPWHEHLLAQVQPHSLIENAVHHGTAARAFPNQEASSVIWTTRHPRNIHNAISQEGLRQSPRSDAHDLPTDVCQVDLDLAAVIGAWGTVPAAIRAGIVIMVKATAVGNG